MFIRSLRPTSPCPSASSSETASRTTAAPTWVVICLILEIEGKMIPLLISSSVMYEARHSDAARSIPSEIIRAPESRAPRPIPGKRYILFAWLTYPIFPFSNGTSSKGLPLAKIMFSPAYLNASTEVHSAFVVGFASGAVSSSEDVETVVEKSVAHEEPRSVAAPVTATRYTNGSVVAHEIKSGFDRAAEAVGEVSKLLEVGKHRYELKSSANRASSKMKAVMTSPSSSKYGDISNIEEDMTMNSRNLSSTLQKLYLWEKKLYEEVRAEEKMRLLLDKNCKRLKHLDEKGAEAHKIDSTRTLINKLSTQIRIAIKVVDSISTKINKLRDEELFLQINELIAGFTRMWNVLLECHRNQCRAISEAKGLDSIANKGKPTDSHMDTVMEFEVELLRLTANFSDWINAQKNFVKAVNGWLVLCLHYEPEMTADGIPPYSPGRVGAPPIFVICNYWSQAMDQISEKEVVATMQSFAVKVRNLREQSNAEQRQMMMESGDMERWLKTREKEKQIIQKELDALNKKLILVPGQSGSTDEVGSLQLGLKQVFEAMENFAASSVKAYEEINLRSEEEKSAREIVS